MSEELLINVSPVESRVAVLNNGIISEIYIERHNKLGLVGNIYLGTVVRVLPGMQAAFVEIGQSRTAFLHVNDMRKKPRNSPNVMPLLGTTVSKPRKQRPPTLLTSMTIDSPDDVAQSHTINNTITNSNADNVVTTQEQTENSAFNNSALNNSALNSSALEGQPVSEGQTNGSDNKYSQNGILSQVSTVPATSPMFTTPSSQSEKEINGLREKKSALAIESDNLNTDPLEEDSPSIVGNAITQVDQEKSVKPKTIQEPPKHLLIQHRLQEGQKILVQVTKDQLGSKGARLTTNISLPSRYLVYLPSSEHIGISQRIDNEEERYRLKSELAQLMQTVNLAGGLIARTAAERVPVAKLEEDIYYLVQLWRTIQSRKDKAALSSQPSELIYQELSLPLRSIRDLVHPDTQRIIVDNEAVYEDVKNFSQEFVPFVYPRIVPYMGEQPLFDVHRVEDDLKDALKRRVDLKSGGYLIIDQTEAMTTIDVNTGSYVGGRSLEDTVYKTNLEATHAIAHQLRLRNLGGIIILDFIDMLEQEHKDDVLESLQQQLSQDYAKTKITQVSELGLIEMTRKRTRESLEQQLCEPCHTCQGKGFIKTAETVCFEIFREIMRCARTYNAPKQFTVVAHAAVIDLLLTSEADTVADLEYLVGRVITFEVENLYTQEQYDIVLD